MTADASETLYWHDMDALRSREISDEQFISQRLRFGLVERRLEPLVMTGDEKIEFLTEYCTGHQRVEATADTPEVYLVFSDLFETVRAPTLSIAICLAAAKWKEMNS